MSDEPRSFGPMHSERTRRRQTVINPPRGELVISVYEHGGGDETPMTPPFLAVELTSDRGNERADLTLEDARWLREALAEFIVAWDEG